MDSFEREALELLKELWVDLRERRKQIKDFYERSHLVDLMSVDAALEDVQKEVGNSLKLRKKLD
ncbi:MAG: hypothetical protein ACJ8CB_19150 [Ktedonobacteraceae bacterium]